MSERSRLLVAVAACVGLVAVVVILANQVRADRRTSPLTAVADSPLQMSQDQPTTVTVADVCAAGGDPLRIGAVRAYGVSGELRQLGVDVVPRGPAEGPVATARLPVVVDEPCGSTDRSSLVVYLQRVDGEAAHADGFEVTYRHRGETTVRRVAQAVTICRDLSEC